MTHKIEDNDTGAPQSVPGPRWCLWKFLLVRRNLSVSLALLGSPIHRGVRAHTRTHTPDRKLFQDLPEAYVSPLPREASRAAFPGGEMAAESVSSFLRHLFFKGMKMMLCSWYIFFEIPKCWKIQLCPPWFSCRGWCVPR